MYVYIYVYVYIYIYIYSDICCEPWHIELPSAESARYSSFAGSIGGEKVRMKMHERFFCQRSESGSR